MHINQFFDHVYCINLDRNTQRWQSTKDQLDKHDIMAERFSAIDGRYHHFKNSKYVTKGLNIYHHNKKINSAMAGLIYTHKLILIDAISKGYNSILILEDDILLVDNFNEMFDKSIKELPGDWEFFYLGGQYDWGKPIPYTQNISLSYKTLGGHAIGMKHTVFEEMLDGLSLRQPNDAFYASNLHLYKAYNTASDLVTQDRDRFISDIVVQ